MMRFHAALATGLATLFVVPALALDEDQLRHLEEALARTTRTLEVLGDMQATTEEDPMAVQRIVAATEAPVLDERGRDQRLEELRNEVGALQMRLDAQLTGLSTAPLAPTAPGRAETGHDASVSPITTGLDDSLRRALGGTPEAQPDAPAAPKRAKRRDSSDAPPPGTPDRSRLVTPTSSPEHPGYSADPIAHAQACFRAARFEEGLRVLAPIQGDPLALYWKARCLERLDRLDEAIEALQEVLRLAPETYEGKRAQTDLEFLEWKRDFVEELPGSGGGA